MLGRLVRRVLAGVAGALAGFGAVRASRSTPDAVGGPREEHRVGPVEVRVLGAQVGVRPELAQRYVGPRTDIAEQVAWMRGRKLWNASLDPEGARLEAETFVMERIR